MQSMVRRIVSRLSVAAALVATGSLSAAGPATAGPASFSCDSTPTVYPVSTQGDVGGLVAGDLNGDGLPDVVTANLAGTASVFLNQGGGVLAPGNRFSLDSTTSTVDGPASPVLADFNGDGHLDLATENQNSGDVSVALGRGDGMFRHVTTYPVGATPASMVAADFNGDGIIDLVTVNRNALDIAGHIALLVGKGDGTFRPARITDEANGPASNLVAGDFNGDGSVDLAYTLTGPNGDTIGVLLNRGNGSFLPAHPYSVGLGAFAIAAGRVNGDGVPDLVTANVTDSTFSVLLDNADGTGTFGPALPTAKAGGQFDVVLGDVNGDGRADIVAANPFNGNIWALLNKGQGRFGSPIGCAVAPDGSSVRGPLHVTTADLNGDGKQDVITSNLGRGSVSISVLITP